LSFTSRPAHNLWLVGSVLIVFGLVLLWADTPGSHEREIEQLSMRDGIVIGPRPRPCRPLARSGWTAALLFDPPRCTDVLPGRVDGSGRWG
jgi:undecaprenyl pyrophosphate phosphatase UppP